jgi:ABC-type phosphate transport system substrate-binding protein
MRTAVQQHQYAIGFVSMYFDLTSTAITGLAIDGVTPTLLNAKSGRYKYVRTLYLITRSAPTGAIQKYIKFALSKHVQDTVVGAYWIPIK